ncbi:MAG: hypothetical protein ACI9O6_000149 [Glaciecola sp.]
MLIIITLSKDFAKEYKYSLGQDMKRDALQLVRFIYREADYWLASCQPVKH